jgi:aminoglycoside phosphotransferase (APT) family kinase protein
VVVAGPKTARELLPGLTRDTLAEYVADRMGLAGLELRSARVAGQGMSDDTILIDAHDSAGNDCRVAIRRYKANGVLREYSDLARQYTILKGLEQTPIPAPAPLWFDPDDAPLGGANIGMTRLDGYTPVPWSPSGQDFLRDAGKGPLGQRLPGLLAEIHAVDWRSFWPDPATCDGGRRPAVGLLDTLEAVLKTSRDGPEPVLVDALGWLRANVPETDELVLVHADYRTGNLMFSDTEITGVLDWEFARPGDPMQDVAWVLAASNRVGSDLACYMMPPDEFVAGYEQQSGRSVSWPAIRFWQVYYQVFNAMCWLNAAHLIRHEQSSDLRMLRWSYTMPTMRQLVLDALKDAE